MMNVKTYRRRAAFVEAMRWRGIEDEAALLAWAGGDAEIREGDVHVRSPFGPVRAVAGDYIVKDERGGLSAWKPALFELSFSEAGEGVERAIAGASSW